MISAVDGHVSSPRTRHRKKKGSKETTYSVPQDGRRPGSAAAAAGSATEGSWNYYQRERERERERKGERGGEREKRGERGEREKGEREKRGREIEGALFFFHTSPEFCFLFILVTCKSLFFLFFLLSPFFLLLSPPTRQMCLFLPPVEISSIMATIPSSSELLSARFRGMGRETAAVLNSSAPNE